MKLRTATPASKKILKRATLGLVSVMIVLALPIHIVQQSVSADKYDDAINALEQEISNYNSRIGELKDQADTYQNALNGLQAEVNTLQAQIELSETRHSQLIEQIKETEQEIALNRDVLGDTIADLYVEGQTTPIEMLASSKNISEYLDKQEYQSSIRDELTSKIEQIKRLKQELEDKKKDVERVLADQKAQRNNLNAKKQEQANLIAKVKGEEAAYQELVKDRLAQIKEVEAEQAAYFASLQNSGSVINVLPGDPNKGGYPANLAHSNYYNPVVDPWGMYSRQCVSYTAWKVHQQTGKMPYWGGIGNAWQWGYSGWSNNGMAASYNTGNWHTSNAQAWGVPYGSEPKEGSVAVKNANPAAGDPYGHTAWVEEVYGNGQIRISQYNWYNAGGSGWGHYSEMNVDSSMFGRYLYFNEW